ncbi:Y+L amino acid transporter 1 [Clonorchis sinensis]|uniref:Y+L amino acid transporter 1 n=1 Tax=Clonorchis sinensis TaxID=79923 RepID=G7Y2F7_CLOSI|nr:Y+L amino acid transporter 1 [Clonorchis sinensis]
MSRKLPKRIRRILERSQLFSKKLPTGDTEDELAFRKMRNRYDSEIRRWNIRKQATVLVVALKNRNVRFTYMGHRRRNKPYAFSPKDGNGEPSSDSMVVSEVYSEHYAGLYSALAPSSYPSLSRRIYERPLSKLVFTAFAVLRTIQRTSSRITRIDFQILHGDYVRPLLEYANQVVQSGRKKGVILIERVQRAATNVVAGLKTVEYETRLEVCDPFSLEYRRLRGDLILTYALFEQGLANRVFTVDPANTRRGHGERQPLNDRNKNDPGNLGESLDPVYQSVNKQQTNMVFGSKKKKGGAQKIELKKDIGILKGVGIVVGIIVGSGIFLSPVGVLRITNSVGLSFIMWIVTGLFSTLGAIVYAELGVTLPRSGVPVVTLCFVNCYRVTWATKLSVVFTVGKVFALLLVIGFGFAYLAKGNVESFNDSFENSATSPGALASAFYQGFWSYAAWNYLNFLTGEMKNPARNLPIVILLSLSLVTVIYVLANVAYLAVLSPYEILNSDAVAVTMANRCMGVMAWIMPVFVAASVFGSINGEVLSMSRLCFTGAEEGHMPSILSMVSVTNLTPIPSVLAMISDKFEAFGSVIVKVDRLNKSASSTDQICFIHILPVWYYPETTI